MADMDTTNTESLVDSTSKESLTTRVVKGAGWVFLGKVAGRGMQMLKLIILARLLAPEDFGLFGIVMLALAILETFTQTGFDTALIQRKGDIGEYLDTAWTVQVIRRLILAAVLFSGAPLVGWFFNEARAVPLMRLMSLSVALSGFVNIGIVYFQKELQFHRQVAYNVLSEVVGLTVGIVLAYRLRNVWALVWAGVAAAGARSVLSYVLHPYRPRPKLDPTHARQLFRFGRWVLGSSVMIYAGMYLDNLMVGKLLGTAALGFYAMAYRLSLLPLEETTYAVSGVLLPGYAKVQNDRRRLQRVYERAVALTGLLSVPACLGMVLLARPTVRLVLGEQWLPVVLPIQLLAFAQLIKSVASTGSSFFLGSGRHQYEFYAQVARVIGLVACIVPAILLFGLEGAALAVVVSALSMFAAYFYCLGRVLDRPTRVLGRALIPPLVGGAAMMAALAYPAVVLSRYSGAFVNQALLLLAAIVAGAIVYFPTCLGVCALYSESSVLSDLRNFLQTLKRMWESLRSGHAHGRADATEVI